jgi:hypothetical protein
VEWSVVKCSAYFSTLKISLGRENASVCAYMRVCPHPLREHLCDGVHGCLYAKNLVTDISSLSLVDFHNSVTFTILFTLNQ